MDIKLDTDKLVEGYYCDEVNGDPVIEMILDNAIEEEAEVTDSLLTIEPYDEGTMIDIACDISDDDIL